MKGQKMYYNNKTPDPVRGPHPEHDLEGKGVPNVISDIVDNWFLCDSRTFSTKYRPLALFIIIIIKKTRETIKGF